MPDLHLQAMLQGVSVKKATPAPQTAPDKFTDAIAHFASQYADKTLKEDARKDTLTSVSCKRQKLIEEAKELAHCAPVVPHIQLAYDLLMTDEALAKAIRADLVQAQTRLDAVDLLQPLPDTLNDLLKLSKKTLDCIFEAGCKKYSDAEYLKSLALFVFLCTVNQNNPEYWFRLGIAAQKSDFIDLAMQAYQNSIQLTPSTVLARLFAAECLITLGDAGGAKAMCEEVKALPHDEDLNQFLLALEMQLSRKAA